MHVFKSIIALCFVVLLAACQTNSFLPVHDLSDGTTLGQRTVSDPHAFSPGTQRSWLEVCVKKVEETLNVTTKKVVSKETTYVEPCAPVVLAGTQFTTFSPYVNGLATPLIQAGAIVGAGYLVGDGLSKSGSTNTTSQTNGGGNATGGNATGGKGGRGGDGGDGGNATSKSHSHSHSSGGCQGNCD